MFGMRKLTYAAAICEGFHYLLEKYPDVFVLGQGLWSPWYVGSSMTGLEKKFGKDRVIDSPVSELACTGAAIGASLFNHRCIAVHPRMDFMLLAMDQMINQAAKWSYMFGGQARSAVTFRGIINRGGEQGAQHSQALHSLFAHIPGLRVVMPTTVSDARDLLIASVLSDDPVLYIDDRWLYDNEEMVGEVKELVLSQEKPQELCKGNDITLVGASYSTHLCLKAALDLKKYGVSASVIDLRVINPLDLTAVISAVKKSGRLLVVDGSWASCGLAGEVIANVMENLDLSTLKASPKRITLPFVPAPTSRRLEEAYYPKVEDIVSAALNLCEQELKVC